MDSRNELAIKTPVGELVANIAWNDPEHAGIALVLRKPDGSEVDIAVCVADTSELHLEAGFPETCIKAYGYDGKDECPTIEWEVDYVNGISWK